MRKIAFILSLLGVLLLASQALAEDGDEGPVVIVEFTQLDLEKEDDLKLFRMMAGYTFEKGFQLGANLTYYSLDRPSVVGKFYCEGYPAGSAVLLRSGVAPLHPGTQFHLLGLRSHAGLRR